MDYPYSSIQLNRREIRMIDIVEGNAKGNDEFEIGTIAFIRDWMSGKDDFILRTSGSTGSPKEIAVRRTEMVASASATAKALSLQRGYHALVCLDPRYVAGQMMLVRCMTIGMHIHSVTPSANPLREYHGPPNDFAAMVPYQVKAIIDSGDPGVLNEIATLIIGGAGVPHDLVASLQTYRGRAFSTYGMTETLSHIALRRLNGPDKTDLYHVLPGISIDTDNRSCLIIDCSYLPAPIRTNDIVRRHTPTTFEVLGRADNVINTGGVKVSPEQLEDKINPLMKSLNLHHRIIISSVSDIALGEKLVLVLETEQLENKHKTVLTSCLEQALPRFEVPKIIVPVHPFPQTPSGKIDRMAIRRMISDLT